MEEAEKYWKILKGKCTLKEASILMGADEAQANQIVGDVKEADMGMETASNFFGVSMAVTKSAYRNLIELNEIDTTRIFNLATHEYDGDAMAQLGDIGIRGNQNFIFNNGWNEW